MGFMHGAGGVVKCYHARQYAPEAACGIGIAAVPEALLSEHVQSVCSYKHAGTMHTDII